MHPFGPQPPNFYILTLPLTERNRRKPAGALAAALKLRVKRELDDAPAQVISCHFFPWPVRMWKLYCTTETSPRNLDYDHSWTTRLCRRSRVHGTDLSRYYNKSRWYRGFVHAVLLPYQTSLAHSYSCAYAFAHLSQESLRCAGNARTGVYGSGGSDVVKARSSSWTVSMPSLRTEYAVADCRSVRLRTIGILSSVASPLSHSQSIYHGKRHHTVYVTELCCSE